MSMNGRSWNCSLENEGYKNCFFPSLFIFNQPPLTQRSNLCNAWLFLKTDNVP